MKLAREIVLTWPAVTEQESRELTRINLRHRERVRTERRQAA
jgi:hypothetical protein